MPYWFEYNSQLQKGYSTYPRTAQASPKIELRSCGIPWRTRLSPDQCLVWESKGWITFPKTNWNRIWRLSRSRERRNATPSRLNLKLKLRGNSSPASLDSRAQEEPRGPENANSRSVSQSAKLEVIAAAAAVSYFSPSRSRLLRECSKSMCVVRRLWICPWKSEWSFGTRWGIHVDACQK